MQIRLKKVIPLMALSGLLSYALVSCGPYNPFWPGADLKVMNVTTTSAPNGVAGIEQDIDNSTNSPTGRVVTYTYYEPAVQIQNEAFGPTVNFTTMDVAITLTDGTVLPTKEYPINARIDDRNNPPALGANNSRRLTSFTLPILSANPDLRAVVYPGNNAPRVENGTASIVIRAIDDNGYNHELNFDVPLQFTSSAFVNNLVPPATPTPTPTPQASPAP